MKKLDLGQAISVLANIGVIAGIIFLAIELDQNNDMLAFQARSTLHTARAMEQLSAAENRGGLAEITLKSRNGEPLTGVEEVQIGVLSSLMVHNYELMYLEVKNGLLSEDDLPIEQWATPLQIPATTDFWCRTRHRYDVDFVQYIEDNVPSLTDSCTE